MTPYDCKQTAVESLKKARELVAEATSQATTPEDIEAARAAADLHIRLAHLALSLAEATSSRPRGSAH